MGGENMIKYIELYVSIVVLPHALIFIYVDYLTGKNKTLWEIKNIHVFYPVL